MRIAVCDDDLHTVQTITAMLKEYDGSAAIDGFLSAAALLEHAKTATYDAVFLDIEMPAPNGYDAAKTLTAAEKHPLIVFVTHTSAYAVRGYGVAFRYLLKPISPDAVRETMQAVEEELRSYRITVSFDGTAYVLDVRRILYAEVLNHTTILHMQDENLTFRAALKELQTQLPARCFGAPHQSYLVNLQHIRSANPQDIVMVNGDRIPVSRRRRKAFLQQFHAYLGGTPCGMC